MNKLTVFKCNGAANIPVLLVRCITASQGYLDHGRSELFSFVAVTWLALFYYKSAFQRRCYRETWASKLVSGQAAHSMEGSNTREEDEEDLRGLAYKIICVNW